MHTVDRLLHRWLATCSVVLAVASSVAVPVAAQDIVGTRDARAMRADSVFLAVDRTDTPGCALGVYDHGNLIYGRGYGMASLELGVPISPRTIFDVGSVSKEFTAMSILLLAQEGKLSLDDPVRRYIPELPPYANGITLRQLLSHTSGIRDHFGLWSVAGRSFEGPADTIDYLRFITRSTRPNFEPGTRYLYSNSGFVLLAQIVYRVTGESLNEFATQHIFTPLGMRATHYKDDHAAIIPNRAEAYDRGRTGVHIDMSDFDMAGEGGIHTNVEEFARWLRNFDDPIVGGPAAIKQFMTPTRLKNDSALVSGPGRSYSLGLVVGTYRGLRYFGHDGSWAGYRANYMDFPDQHFAVAVFCNFGYSGPDTLSRKVAGIYLDRVMGPDSAAAWRVALEAAPAEAMTPAALQTFTGVWRNVDLGSAGRTTVSGDSLILQVPGRRVRLTPIGGRRFRTDDGATEYRFEGDSAGVPARLVAYGASGITTFTRVPEAVLSPEQLAEYAGTYYTADVDVTQQIRVEKGVLEVRRDGRHVMNLTPLYKDGFAGSGGNILDFTRGKNGRVDGFLLEAGRVRHLEFVRTTGR